MAIDSAADMDILFDGIPLADVTTSMTISGPAVPVFCMYLAAAERQGAGHPLLWGGDGRITAGHLAVLAERAAAGPLNVIMFDGMTGPGWSWSQRDEAMAGRILAGSPAGTRTLAVAGNAHTAISPTGLGVPLGAYLAQRRPGCRRSASTTAAGITTTCGPASSARSAPSRARHGRPRSRGWPVDGRAVACLHRGAERGYLPLAP